MEKTHTTTIIPTTAVTSNGKASTNTKAKVQAPRRYTDLRALELQIFEKEGITVVFRAAPEILVPGEGYSYKNRLKKNATLKHLKKRIEYALRFWKGSPIDYVIVQGNGKLVRQGWENQALAKIIDSYGSKE